MKILISHVYSLDNKGDAAILGVLVDEARAQFPDCTIVIHSMDAIKDGSLFDDAPMHHSLMYHVNNHLPSKLAWAVYGMFMMPYTLLYGVLYSKFRIQLPLTTTWREVIDDYKEADIAIPVGGGYLRTKPGIGSIYDFMLLLHPVVLAKSLGTPTVLHSQSVGPVHRTSERFMLKWAIKYCVELAIIREDKSMKLLDSIGVKNKARSVDAGFLLKSDPTLLKTMKVNFPKGKTIIGVTAREWLNKASQAAYETALADALDYMIVNHNAHIVFIPQVTSESHSDDDRLTNNAIFEIMEHKNNISLLKENYDYHQVKAIYSGLDVLLGTRFHSVIFSLTSFVPALAIEYEHKTSGIMNDLKLGDWVIKMEDVDADKLIAKLELLLNEQDSYRARLKSVLPEYIQRAHSAIVLVDESLKSYNQHNK